MGKAEDDLHRKLLAAFKIESAERLKAISSGLLEIEKSPASGEPKTTVETIFREVHSLKGAARAVNMTEIGAVCRSLEDIFAAWKRNELSPTPECFDILYGSLDSIEKLLSSPDGIGVDLSELLKQLSSLKSGDRKSGAKTVTFDPGKRKDLTSFSDDSARTEKTTRFETVRIPIAKLDSLLLQTEQMLSVRLAMGQRADDMREVFAGLDQWNKEWRKVYPKVRRVWQSSGSQIEKRGEDHRQRALLEFFDWNYNHIKSIEDKLKSLAFSTELDRRFLGGMVDNLLGDMKKVLMLPFSSILDLFPRLVRDLSREQGKKIKLVIHGNEIEVDRRILEEMKDPLIHLVRNCIDHGIEKPEVRANSNKWPQGKITIGVSNVNSGRVEILIADDGAGIALSNVKEVAVRNGMLSEEEADQLEEQAILPLIFEPGLSTNPIITDISGRGLGLSIVQEKIDRLGGHMTVESEPRVGASFRMVLPSTLTTFRGVVVQANRQVFVVPSTYVKQVVRIKKDTVKTLENRETISLNGHTLSLVRLDAVLALPNSGQNGSSSDIIPALVLSAAGKSIAFGVDKILNEQEVLVKAFNRQLSRLRNITGATIFGSGRAVPVLNVSDLIKSAVNLSAAPARPSISEEEEAAKKKSILVAEDSITSRMLLKNILETAGYWVKTAIDGAEAFTTLQTEEFDLVVSDVDMPRMNGFDLTAKIRSSEKFAELPVVLVTALESREDRERGIDVGANAYIVKSSFDQSNLLEVIQRFI